MRKLPAKFKLNSNETWKILSKLNSWKKFDLYVNQKTSQEISFKNLFIATREVLC